MRLRLEKVFHFGFLNNRMMSVSGRSYEFGDESRVDACKLECLVKLE